MVEVLLVKVEEYKKAVLIAGLIAGVLSATPIVDICNIFCCLWIVLGGLIGVYVISKDVDRKIEYGEGAFIGLLIGLVAAVVSTIVDTVFTIFGLELIPEWLLEEVPQLAQLKELEAGMGLGVLLFIGLVVSLVTFGAFGALGGIIGTAIYGKKKDTSETT